MNVNILKMFGLSAAIKEEIKEKELRQTAATCQYRKSVKGTTLCNVCAARNYCR